MANFIPLSVPNLKGNELKYITDAIQSEWVSTGGAYIERFEKELAEYVQVPQAVACQSGTAGIHLALLLSDVCRGDLVFAPTLTFIAAVNPIKYIGAEPILMDCDDTLTLDAKKLENFCEEECIFEGNRLSLKKTGQPIKAIVVVHVFGNMADMDKIMSIAKKYNLKVIEDATESLGTYYTQGKYKGQHAGTIGDFGVYSFNGNKIITTGGGGMLVCKDEKMLKKGKYLSTQAKDNEVYFFHNEIGYNYRMTNLQAAVGVAQLEQLEDFIKVKEENYLLYQALLEKVEGVRIGEFRKDIRANYWFYTLILEDLLLVQNRDKIIELLKQGGVQTRPIWGLIHEQKPYKGVEIDHIEVANDYYKRVINIPCSSNLTKVEVEKVVELLKEIICKIK